jgi:hypothetical protein
VEFAYPAGVRDHLRKHPIAFADLGEQKVKNIAQPGAGLQSQDGGGARRGD